MPDPTLVRPVRPVRPVRHDALFETFEEAETTTTDELLETVLKMATTMADPTGHVVRSVHAKSHGLRHGQLQVLDGLPPELAQGLFAQPCTYPLRMRLLRGRCAFSGALTRPPCRLKMRRWSGRKTSVLSLL